jgi:hypothetical protein
MTLPVRNIRPPNRRCAINPLSRLNNTANSNEVGVRHQFVGWERNKPLSDHACLGYPLGRKSVTEFGNVLKR